MRSMIAALVLLVAQVASADTTPTGTTQDFCQELHKRDPKAKCKSMVIEPTELTGTHAMPLNEISFGRTVQLFGSLIKVRADFVDKVVASANNL